MEDQKDIRKELSGLGEHGYISFKIKYNNTEENRQVHDIFRKFAETETDNHYLLALKKLLENYSDDYRFEALWEKISLVESAMVELTQHNQPKQEEKKKEEEPSKFF